MINSLCLDHFVPKLGRWDLGTINDNRVKMINSLSRIYSHLRAGMEPGNKQAWEQAARLPAKKQHVQAEARARAS